VAADDILAMQIVNENFLNASNEILASAYKLNTNLRNNTLEHVPDLYSKFSVTDVNFFNGNWTEYSQILTYTGNSVELMILAAINGMVGSMAYNLDMDYLKIYNIFSHFRRDQRLPTFTLFFSDQMTSSIQAMKI
jgi:hypothetical protein